MPQGTSPRQHPPALLTSHRQVPAPGGKINGLILLFALLLVGCAAAEPDRTWQRIQQQGVLRVGMEASWQPFEFIDPQGQLVGFDVELAQALGERLGVNVQFVANLSFDGLYDALAADRVDVVISALIVDPSRSADVSFSTPYFDAGQVLVVGQGADISGMRDLSGRVLAVVLGSDGDALARHWARRLVGMSLLHTDTATEAVQAVAQGHAAAALIDRASALLALRQTRIPGLRINSPPLTGEQFAAAVRRDSDALLRALNAALDELRRDGTLKALEEKWLGRPSSSDSP